MMTDVSPGSEPDQLLKPYFVFDSDLNLVADRDGSRWPAAVLIVLRACVRKARAEERSSFRPLGLGPAWRIAPFDCAGSQRLAVFVDQASERIEWCCGCISRSRRVRGDVVWTNETCCAEHQNAPR